MTPEMFFSDMVAFALMVGAVLIVTCVISVLFVVARAIYRDLTATTGKANPEEALACGCDTYFGELCDAHTSSLPDPVALSTENKS